MSRRDDIIDAAIRLAAGGENGQLVSVRAVAKEAGIGASTLRHYFPTQADLHEAIVAKSLTTAVKDFSIADASLTPEERLMSCLSQFLLAEGASELQLTVWLDMHINALGPERKELSRRLLAHGHELTYSCLHRWLGILADEGHLDPAEVAPASTALFTMIDGLSLHAAIASGESRGAEARASGTADGAASGGAGESAGSGSAGAAGSGSADGAVTSGSAAGASSTATIEAMHDQVRWLVRKILTD